MKRPDRPGFIGHAKIIGEKRVRPVAKAKSEKPHKYGAKKAWVDGVRFDSKAEAKRYSHLKMLERSGIIRDLVLQPEFVFLVEDKVKIKYRADFQYVDVASGKTVVEDVKGHLTREYIFKRKLMKVCRGIIIHEVK